MNSTWNSKIDRTLIPLLICNFLVFLPESSLWPSWQEDPSLVVPAWEFIIYKSPGEPFFWKLNLRFVLVLGRLVVLKILYRTIKYCYFWGHFHMFPWVKKILIVSFFKAIKCDEQPKMKRDTWQKSSLFPEKRMYFSWEKNCFFVGFLS